MNKNYKNNQKSIFKQNYNIILFFILFLLFIILNLSYQIFKINNFKSDLLNSEIAKEDLIIKKDIVIIDDLANEEEKKVYLEDLPPVYNLYDSIFYRQWNFYDRLFTYISKERNVPLVIERYIKNQTEILIKNPKIIPLLIILADNQNAIKNFRTFLYNLYSIGIINQKSDKIYSNSKGIVIIDWYRQYDTVRKEVRVDQFITEDSREKRITELYEQIFQSTIFDQNLLLEEKQIFLDFIQDNLKENLFYDQLQTDELKKSMLKSFIPKTLNLKAGTVIVKKGEEITPEKKRLILLVQKSLESNRFQILFSFFILLLLIGIIISFYLFKYSNSLNLYKRYIFYFYVLLLLAFVSFVLYDLGSIKLLNGFLYFPILLFYLLIEFAYSKKEIPIISLSFIIVLFIMTNFDYILLFYGLLLFTFLLFFPLNFVSFKKLIFSKALLSLIITLMFSFIVKIAFTESYKILDLIISGVINIAFSIILYFGLVPILENIFNFPTVSKLMEICDLNNHFFSEFMLKAPGTYHHSVIVATLAENAASNCDANPYITKAGGLYHDIGKIKYSKYFVENQHGENPTIETLNPNMAVTIIKNHVKTGISEAKKLHLPKEVIDIIEQHHGTSLISYFYVKALEKKLDNIDKSYFCYNYPKPNSKEAAIIMIADAIEAASRTLKNTDKKSIEKMVDDVISTKSKDGQLDESPLTLADLENIRKSMINNLYSMYHNRIDYPDEKKLKKLENEKR